MDEVVTMSELAQEYWDFVLKLHQITGKLLKDRDNLKDPNEKEMRLIFNIQQLTAMNDEDSN